MAKDAKAEASEASKDAKEAKKIGEEAKAEAATLASALETANKRLEVLEEAKKSGGGTTTVVRSSSGSGHDVTARLANWRIATAIFLAGGDDLAMAKAKATKFVVNPKGSEDELWRAAATVREKVRETGPDLSKFASQESLEAEARTRAEGDRALESKIPDVTKIASAVATALANDGFVARPELTAKLETKADRAEVESLQIDMKNIDEELSAKADSAEVEGAISRLREETGMSLNQLASALAALSQADDAGRVVNHPIGSAITGLLGRDKDVKKSPDAEEARIKAAATARAIAAKYAAE